MARVKKPTAAQKIQAARDKRIQAYKAKLDKRMDMLRLKVDTAPNSKARMKYVQDELDWQAREMQRSHARTATKLEKMLKESEKKPSAHRKRRH